MLIVQIMVSVYSGMMTSTYFKMIVLSFEMCNLMLKVCVCDDKVDDKMIDLDDCFIVVDVTFVVDAFDCDVDVDDAVVAFDVDDAICKVLDVGVRLDGHDDVVDEKLLLMIVMMTTSLMTLMMTMLLMMLITCKGFVLFAADDDADVQCAAASVCHATGGKDNVDDNRDDDNDDVETAESFVNVLDDAEAHS